MIFSLGDSDYPRLIWFLYCSAKSERDGVRLSVRCWSTLCWIRGASEQPCESSCLDPSGCCNKNTMDWITNLVEISHWFWRLGSPRQARVDSGRGEGWFPIDGPCGLTGQRSKRRGRDCMGPQLHKHSCHRTSQSEQKAMNIWVMFVFPDLFFFREI